MGRRSALIEQSLRFQRYRTDNRQALGAELVHRVLGGVPKHIVVAVIEVDQICRRYSALEKRDMVIGHAHFALEEMRLIANLGCGPVNEVFEPGSRHRIAFDIRSASPIISSSRNALT